MPGCGIHLILASRVANSFRDRSERASFFAGAIAPDMGYFPGGDRFTSDLAHYVRAGELARSLKRCANEGYAASFARGWATHVLADILIHPLINRAASELAGNSPSNALTFADNPVAHIRVEQGLDAVIAARFRPSRFWRARNQSFVAVAVRLLSQAYGETYHYASSIRHLTRSCQAVSLGVPLLLRYGRSASQLFGACDGRKAEASRGAFALARLATALFPRSPLNALSRPHPPSDWLLSEVSRAMDEFPARFSAIEASGLADLPDCNLDTGELENVPYPLALAAREELARRGGTI